MAEKRRKKHIDGETVDAPIDGTAGEGNGTPGDPLAKWREEREALKRIRQACRDFRTAGDTGPNGVSVFVARVFRHAGVERA
jgi:hypothetical protein